ncbi:hypothetical protein J437_LFUL007864 [Ladona fulva]|uniref:glutathione transferase n=1 Tax=Ladona fulva TaxID=123851 RepID=A0A8K0K0T1_LADFU|nr:hypothetical protein J437_LFUL007864 [Ladona fulva]
MLLSYGGVEFEDRRVAMEEWAAMKMGERCIFLSPMSHNQPRRRTSFVVIETRERNIKINKSFFRSEKPFGKIPTLEIDGKVLHQSIAIQRYLAKQFKLTGANAMEDLQCDMMVDTTSDLRTQVVALFHEKDEKKKEAMRKTMVEETLPFYLQRMDAEVKKNSGYFVAGKGLAEPIRFLFAYGGVEFEDLRFGLEEWPAQKAKFCRSEAMAPKYRLTYFPVTVLGEPIRMLLSYGGVQFEDRRVTTEEWARMKKDSPFGKLPMLEIDGKVIHQSIAIQRYLAKQFKLTGANAMEELQCDMMVDTISDLRSHATAIHYEKDEKRKEELRKTLVNETMPFYLQRIDSEIKKNSGHVVAGKLTWADIHVVAILEFIHAWLKLPFFEDDKYPSLKLLVANVMNVPAIKDWIKKRPKNATAIHYEKDEKRKEELRKTLVNETMPFYLQRIDSEIKKNSGHVVAGKIFVLIDISMATKCKLTYFPTMGLAEPIRVLLSYGNVDFEDFRFKSEDWPEIKKGMPFGRVPTLEIDGKVIHQSIAIQRYLGRKFKLNGANDWEDLQIDMTVDTMNDLRSSFTSCFKEENEERKEELKKVLFEETVPFYLKKFDEQVKENSGYFVAGKLTWADIHIIIIMDFIQTHSKMSFLDDGTYPNLKSLKAKVMSVPSTKSWIDKRPKPDCANPRVEAGVKGIPAPLTYKLTYFPIMGLAEPIRFLFAYGGVEYEDHRFNPDDWPRLKPTTPFGKVPILEVDGKVVHQSIAIQRYLAKEFQLTGKDDWEDLHCDMIVDTMTDFRMQVVGFFHEKDERKKEEMRKILINDTMPFYLKRFDEIVGKNSGYFVGGKLTWADLHIISILDFLQSYMKMTFLDDGTYPNLKIVKDHVMDVPSIKSWVERRPKTER